MIPSLREVEILDMSDATVAKKAKGYGIGSNPAVVIDGKVADCFVGRAPREAILRAAGIGKPPLPIPLIATT